MLRYNRYLLATTALLAASLPAVAASVPLLTGPGGSNPAQFPADLPDINNTINAINSTGSTGINPNTMAPFAGPRNFLDNGAINIAQRGTSAITGASTCNVVGSTQAYVADRWCVTSNVGSSAATGQVVTSSPTPLTGFTNSMNVTRVSGALTQPICAIQEVPSLKAVNLQGQQVTFSAYLQALAGLSADNGSVVNMTVIYGTGSDQGLQTYNAATGAVPAWTGVNSSAITGAKTVTTSWGRYSVTGTIPTTATEVGVMICFTPSAGSGGSTDGFAMVGTQLEQGSTPSTYEFQTPIAEAATAQRFYVRMSEPSASQTLVGFTGLQITSQNCTGFVSFPVTMRTNPSYTNQLTATTFGVVGGAVVNFAAPIALASTFSNTVVANNTGNATIKFITGSGTNLVAGQSCNLVSVGGGGQMSWSADF